MSHVGTCKVETWGCYIASTPALLQPRTATGRGHRRYDIVEFNVQLDTV